MSKFANLLANSVVQAQVQGAINDRAPNNLRADVTRMTGERDALAPAVARNIGAIGNARTRLSRQLGRDATMRAAQGDNAPATSFAGTLAAATRRARARQGIVNRGERAIENQSLRDRIAVARQNSMRRGSLHEALAGAANIREGVQQANASARQMIAESRANMFGSLAGGLTSLAASYFGNRPGSVSRGVDQGTAAADYMNMNGPAFDFTNPEFVQPAVYG